MANNKPHKKVQFLPFFPYGCCSRQATTIVGKSNANATTLLLWDDPDETIRQAEAYKKNALDRAKTLCEKGLVKETKKQCGTPPKERTFRTLTRDGFAALIEIPDKAIQHIEEEDASATTKDYDGKIKGTYHRSNSTSAATLRADLYDCATSPFPEDQAQFQELLLEAVISGQATPFTAGIGLPTKIKITTAFGNSRNQLYDIWRYSHVQAMFLANDHLTYLDRRPYDTGFAIGQIKNEDSYQAHVQKYGHTIQAFTYRTLTDWYGTNPGYFRIKQQRPDNSNAAREKWLRTPAFYRTSELPKSQNSVEKRENLFGSQQTIYHTHIGIAVGKKVNYVCYHTRPDGFRWIEKREKDAKRDIEEAVRHMKTRCPQFQCKDTLDFAIHFCPTYHQFLAIFKRTIQNHKEGAKMPYTTNKPYTSMHIIPVNDTGTFLLWCLLENSPMEAEATLIRGLMAQEKYFAHTTDPHYPLTYNGKRVFLGYTMDIQKINHALEDHLDGMDFYICCFPEQATWYRKLFPGKIIL